MAITINRRRTGGSATLSGRQWRWEFDVLSDDAVLTEVAAVAALTAEPWEIELGDEHPDDSDAVCSQIEPQAIGDDGRSYRVSVVFETPRGGVVITNPNPTLRPAEIEWDYEGQMVSIFEDMDDEPILNSARERFDPLPEHESGELTLRFIRNEATPNFATIRQYQNAVNDDAFTVAGVTIPARVAKLTIRPGRQTTENGVTFFPVEYHFKFKADEWQVKLLDVGLYELIDGERSPIRDIDNQEITTPVRLDGSGGVLPDASPSQYVGPFKFYHERDFSVFSFT